MNTKYLAPATRTSICLAVAAVCTILSGPAPAKPVDVSITVSTAGLDLSRSADARQLYDRLRHAARIVCSHGNRVDLQVNPDFEGCYEKVLAQAVRALNRPQLTMAYMSNH